MEPRRSRALVTGASSGIGAAIARELAARNIDLVLTARRKAALEELAAELRKSGASVAVIVGDLGRPGAAATLWRDATAGGAIDIVVNNAGFGAFRPFLDVEPAREAEMIQLNIAALVELSRAFLAAREGATTPGYLLNISSIGAYQSVPNMAVYASSKAFVRNFTEALHDELRGTPTSATCVSPGGTHTDFHRVAGAGDYGWLANASMLSAEAVASIAVRAMFKRKRTVIPGALNKISCFGIRFVPRWFASWMARRVMGKPRPGALPSRTSAA